MKSSAFLCLIFLSLWFLAGCVYDGEKLGSSHKASIAPSEEISVGMKTLVVATGDMSGVYFPLGQGLSAIFEKYNGSAAGTRVTNASIQNAKLVSEKQADLGICMVDVLSLKEINQQNLRALTGLYSNYIQIVTTDRSIQSLEDLRGKRVSLGTEGSGTKLTAERVMEAANLMDKDIDFSYLSFTQSAAGLRNGTIDAAFLSSGLPNPVIQELIMEMDVNLVSIPKEVAEGMKAAYGVYSWEEISADTYESLEESVSTVTVKNVLLTNADLPDKEAYQLLQTIYQHLDEWKDFHPAAESIHPDEAMEDIPIEFHNGAKKYFKEIGGE
ncbi:TAXI family TRAP transporter solute-binding subunit [Bacillus sp. CRN 9]|uniref:TAXI family TRAP transporter solute-binding subunit n=1 Tax=Cytobacillus horneckiae TaxID=549687 RepID=UPI001562A6DA|nr:TAXI family TRAP transporter solute-binding subunit [Bacillus sp. CRN 9]